MANHTEKRNRAALHGRGARRMHARPLTAREVTELRSRNVARPDDRRRRAGIEQLRRALHDRFGGEHGEEVANG